MIKSSAFGIRQLVLAASAALLCGLTSVSAWADGGLSLGLAVPGLSVFLGDPLAYYAPPPPPPPPGYYVAAMPARAYGPRLRVRRGPPPWAGRWRHDDGDR